MHIEGRNGAEIQRIYIHTNEGPEQPNGAVGLAQYLLNNGPNGGGYHIVDGDTLVRIANDDEIVWGEGGDNEHALSIVFEGYAAQTPEQWADVFSTGELGRAAAQVAEWCKQYNIPAVHVAPGAPGEAPTQRGIAEHADDHSPYSQGHTDPGSGFPLDNFIKLVAAIVSPPVIDWGAIAKIAAWIKRLTTTPLKYGDVSPDVKTLQAWLLVNDFDAGVGVDYGRQVEAGVARFKAEWALPNRDGAVCGGTCAAALVKHANTRPPASK